MTYFFLKGFDVLSDFYLRHQAVRQRLSPARCAHRRGRQETEGYLGEEAWEDTNSGRISNVYYWESQAGLKQLMEHPNHQEAKRRYSEWLSGYQVIIAEVLRSLRRPDDRSSDR